MSDHEREFFTVWKTNSEAPNIVTSIEQFIWNYSCRYEYHIWGADVDWNLFVIAGGSVISSLLVEMRENEGSDVDLFFMEGDSHLFLNAVVSEKQYSCAKESVI